MVSKCNKTVKQAMRPLTDQRRQKRRDHLLDVVEGGQIFSFVSFSEYRCREPWFSWHCNRNPSATLPLFLNVCLTHLDEPHSRDESCTI